MSEIGQQIIAAIRAKAEENPEYVYGDSCVYVHSGQPACIVGHGLWNAGLIEEDFERDIANGEGVEYTIHRLALDVDDGEIVWLEMVQSKQDRGTPWGEAVKYADARC